MHISAAARLRVPAIGAGRAWDQAYQFRVRLKDVLGNGWSGNRKLSAGATVPRVCRHMAAWLRDLHRDEVAARAVPGSRKLVHQSPDGLAGR